MPSQRVTIAGSERVSPAGCRRLGAAPAETRLQVTVRLRARPSSETLGDVLATMESQSPRQRQYLSRAQFAQRFGADSRDAERVERFAHEYGLTVCRVNLDQRTMRLEGTVKAFRAAFGVSLKRSRWQGGIYRTRVGVVQVPRALADIVVGVHGLDNRPVATPHFRRRRAGKRSTSSSFTAPQIAQLYDFPDSLTGAGQCIALIELNDTDSSGKANGAGYKQTDLAAYFKKLKIAPPAVSAVGIDGGANIPGKSEADGEVVLDIEVAGAIAPQAKIAVYFAPNTTDGFIDAVKGAVHDDVRRPSVVSISWGGPEDPGGQLTEQFLQGLNEAIEAAAALGVTVCVAAGDSGSADMSSGWDGKPHADFPASSPYSLACGGTKLSASGARILGEVVWNEGARGGATGGGVSDYFAKPTYQDSVTVPASPTGFVGRGLPDVAGDADPESGYQIYLDGSWQVIGGTSAVAPLMAGLLALINQQLQQLHGKSAGWVQPLIYGSGGPACFRDITSGNNDMTGSLHGEYSAAVGWDACSGFGVADGARLRQLLSA